MISVWRRSCQNFTCYVCDCCWSRSASRVKVRLSRIASRRWGRNNFSANCANRLGVYILIRATQYMPNLENKNNKYVCIFSRTCKKYLQHLSCSSFHIFQHTSFHNIYIYHSFFPFKYNLKPLYTFVEKARERFVKAKTIVRDSFEGIACV